MKDASNYRANRIVFDSDSDAEATAAEADATERVNHTQSDKQVDCAVLLSCGIINKHSTVSALTLLVGRHVGHLACKI